MCVAVKDGTGIKKAWVLEIGTVWFWSYVREWQRRHEGDPKAVAVAFEQLPYEHRPDVVKLSQILSTWDEYQAETTRQRDEVKKAYEKEQRRRDNYRVRFEKLNLGEHAELEAQNGWVRIRLDVLEARLSDERAIGKQRDSGD
jgi:hypothetical protein